MNLVKLMLLFLLSASSVHCKLSLKERQIYEERVDEEEKHFEHDQDQSVAKILVEKLHEIADSQNEIKEKYEKLEKKTEAIDQKLEATDLMNKKGVVNESKLVIGDKGALDAPPAKGAPHIKHPPDAKEKNNAKILTKVKEILNTLKEDEEEKERAEETEAVGENTTVPPSKPMETPVERRTVEPPPPPVKPDAAFIRQAFKERSYDYVDRPDTLNEYTPLQVNVSMYIRNINNINEREGTFDCDVTVRQIWVDPRLANISQYGGIKLSSEDPHMKIWRPDLFFQNSVDEEVHLQTTRNELIKLEENGKIILSNRYRVTLLSAIDTRKFPFDVQVLKMKLASYGYPSDQIALRWVPLSIPVKVHNNDTNIWVWKNTTQHYYYIPMGKSVLGYTGFDCLQVEMTFARRSGRYLIRIFVPQITIIVLHLLALTTSAGSAKVNMNMCLLVLNSILLGLGNVSTLENGEVQALDIWLMCTFLFSVLAVAIAMLNTRNINWNPQHHLEEEEHEKMLNGFGAKNLSRSRVLKKGGWLDKSLAFSNVVFLTLFLIYNITFWIIVV